jgi:hypothetical protein
MVHVPSGASGDLCEFRRGQSARTTAVELRQFSEGDVIEHPC